MSWERGRRVSLPRLRLGSWGCAAGAGAGNIPVAFELA